MKTPNDEKRESLDFLVIGTSHDTYHNDLMTHLPDSTSIYVNAENVDLSEVENIFLMRNPKRTLILAEFDKRDKDHLMNNLFNLLLKLKLPGQKVLAAGFFKYDHPNYMRLPSSPQNIIRKLDLLE